MDGCAPDGAWGLALIDVARVRLADLEQRVEAIRLRAARIVDDTGWRSQGVAAYRRRAAAWEEEVADVGRRIGEAREDLAGLRRDLVARSTGACG